MNPEDHDNNRMRLMHLLRLKPVQCADRLSPERGEARG